MAIIKCKMCGGDLALTEGQSVAECEYCGTLQTVPSADNEKKLNLFASANKLRLSCEFDRAAGIYDAIKAEFPSEAEAYWGLVLCKYGIEYVDDPATGKKIPTCHRSSFDSVLTDVNFDLAVANADVVARRVYRREAEELERIRQGILSVSSSEAPYDIFICYKETDPSGNRTVDSVLAQDIYDTLTDKGYRVFFSRISLEDKLGQAYEPYIFAALNSAKIMLAVGTSFENYNAVWVKNEWSRYLKIISQDKSKHLFPCYKNIDPYDMPREFAHLQGQDMGKVGAMQDLIRGIEKHLPRNTAPVRETVVRERVVVQQSFSDPGTAALVTRGKMALEDKAWAKADKFFEDALNRDAECAEAYLGKVLAQERCGSLSAMVAQHISACVQAEEQKALINEKTDKFLGDVLSKTAELAGAISADVGDKAAGLSDLAKRYLVSTPVVQKVSLPLDIDRTQRAIRLYRLPNYLDVETIREMYSYDLSYESKEEFRKQQRIAEEAFWNTNKNLNRAVRFAEGTLAEELAYVKKDMLSALDRRIQQAAEESRDAREKVKAAYADFLDRTDKMVEQLHKDLLVRREEDYQTLIQTGETETDGQTLLNVANALTEMGEFKDARLYAAKFRKKGMDAKEQQDMEADRVRYYEAQERERKRKKKKRNSRIRALVILVAFIALCVVAVTSTEKDYKEADALLSEGKYAEAAQAFEALGEFDDSADKAREAAYLRALELLEAEDYDAAIDAFADLGDYKDSRQKLEEAKYLKQFAPAEDLLTQGRTAEAAMAFYKLGDKQRSFELWDQVAYRETICAVPPRTAALRADGTVVIVGAKVNSNGAVLPPEYDPCDVKDWRDIVSISLGGGHTVGLKSDGTVVAVGANEHGQCEVSDWTDIVAISAGGWHTLGLRADGTVLVACSGEYPWIKDLLGVQDWENIVTIKAGYTSATGIKADGDFLECGISLGIGYFPDIIGYAVDHNIVNHKVVENKLIGVKENGTIVTAGEESNVLWTAEFWTDVMAVDMCYGYIVALGVDGTVKEAGQYSGKGVSKWMDIVAVSTAGSHTVGLKSDGTVVAVGNNGRGQCAVSNWTDIALPGELTMTAQSETTLTAAPGELENVINIASAEFITNTENP